MAQIRKYCTKNIYQGEKRYSCNTGGLPKAGNTHAVSPVCAVQIEAVMIELQ